MFQTPKEYIFKKCIDTTAPIEKEKDKKEEKKTVTPFPEISFDEFTKTVILVGKVLTVDDIQKSDKLYYLLVDFGQYGQRKIASGIKQYYKKEDLIDIKSIFSFNLAPRQLCGVTSEGMILMGKNIQGIPEIIKIGEQVPEGTRIG